MKIKTCTFIIADFTERTQRLVGPEAGMKVKFHFQQRRQRFIVTDSMSTQPTAQSHLLCICRAEHTTITHGMAVKISSHQLTPSKLKGGKLPSIYKIKVMLSSSNFFFFLVKRILFYIENAWQESK